MNKYNLPKTGIPAGHFEHSFNHVRRKVMPIFFFLLRNWGKVELTLSRYAYLKFLAYTALNFQTS